MFYYFRMGLMLCFAWCTNILSISAQNLAYSTKGNLYFKELPNPVKTDTISWSRLIEKVNVSFASADVRYPKEKIPAIDPVKAWHAKAWSGEKINTQVLLWTNVSFPSIRFELTDLKNEQGLKINKKALTASFVRYVLTDTFEDGCAHEAPHLYDSTLVEDPIDRIAQMPATANSVRPIWLSVDVPSNTHPGKYTGKMIVQALGRHELQITIEVLDHVLPVPAKWKYDLDLWQYPGAIAEMHQVKPWSKVHFELMKPYFQVLAGAGQKVITANIINQPWGNDHAHFKDSSLIKWVKRKHGGWYYDFSLFNRYVSFVKSCGITQRINCYSMLTWDLSFTYFDESKGMEVALKLEPGTKSYNDFWRPMLLAFTENLKRNMWFNHTAIAMDERPIESMQAVIALLKSIDPKWQVALAGDVYHAELEKSINDYALASYITVPDSVMARRRTLKIPTTFYTACVEEYPNGYTFSPPAENTFLGWYAAAKGYSGYLFWAFNSWVSDPLQDSRWKRYPAGTLFQFYPGPRTSIRFEKLREGIQDFEKIRLLREEFQKRGELEKLDKLNGILAAFELDKLQTIPASTIIQTAKLALNEF